MKLSSSFGTAATALTLATAFPAHTEAHFIKTLPERVANICATEHQHYPNSVSLSRDNMIELQDESNKLTFLLMTQSHSNIEIIGEENDAFFVWLSLKDPITVNNQTYDNAYLNIYTNGFISLLQLRGTGENYYPQIVFEILPYRDSKQHIGICTGANILLQETKDITTKPSTGDTYQYLIDAIKQISKQLKIVPKKKQFSNIPNEQSANNQ